MLLACFLNQKAYSQCTISCGATPCTRLWVNSPATCSNGGTIIIPAGVTLEFDDNGDTWTGTNIEIFGVLKISAPGQVTINSSITIKSGGTLSNQSKINLGSASGCGYTLSIESGGTFDIVGSTPDRLNICGIEIARGGSAGCNAYPAGPVPYCEPGGGFTGPIVLNQGGLPIELLYFRGAKGLNKISLSWATASELNFDYFDIEKSSDGMSFTSIARVNGFGTTNERKDYSLEDEKPYIGKNYYRLKSVDFDGFTEYFNVVMVDFDGKKNFSVHPNPSDGVSFIAETNFVPQNRAFIAIYSTIGSEIARYEISGDVSTITLPVKLESGVYYAKYISLDFNSTNRVLVK